MTPETVPAQVLRDLYRTVARIRAVELTLQAHIERHGFGGFWHPGIGQEGLQAGAVAALRREDYLLYAHRGLGYALAKGMPLAELFGDLFGRTTGSTRGKGGGTLHFASPALGVLGQGGTLGSCFPIAVGAALSARLLREDRVVIAFFGEGASARGTFHEAALEAAVWKLPIVWICENNGWAISAPFHEHSPTERVAERAAAYGMPGVVVDGQDAVAVYLAVEDAVKRARQGDGPTLIEAITLRIRGHYEGDRQRYRADASVPEEDVRRRDPVVVLRERLDETEAAAIDAAAHDEVVTAFAAALEAEKPTREAAFAHVWVQL